LFIKRIELSSANLVVLILIHQRH